MQRNTDSIRIRLRIVPSNSSVLFTGYIALFSNAFSVVTYLFWLTCRKGWLKIHWIVTLGTVINAIAMFTGLALRRNWTRQPRKVGVFPSAPRRVWVMDPSRLGREKCNRLYDNQLCWVLKLFYLCCVVVVVIDRRIIDNPGRMCTFTCTLFSGSPSLSSSVSALNRVTHCRFPGEYFNG